MEDKIFNELAEIKRLTMLSGKKVLNLDDVSLITGLSKSHLYKLTWKKSIPYYKNNGKLIYFNRDEVENWCLRYRVKTSEEIEQEAVVYTVTGKRKGGVQNV